jgi:hypothetical protein
MRLSGMLLAILTAVVGLTATAAAAGAPTRTRIVVFTPFTINGQLAQGIKVTQTISGSCWTGSEGSRRSDNSLPADAERDSGDERSDLRCRLVGQLRSSTPITGVSAAVPAGLFAV